MSSPLDTSMDILLNDPAFRDRQQELDKGTQLQALKHGLVLEDLNHQANNVVDQISRLTRNRRAQGILARMELSAQAGPELVGSRIEQYEKTRDPSGQTPVGLSIDDRSRRLEVLRDNEEVLDFFDNNPEASVLAAKDVGLFGEAFHGLKAVINNIPERTSAIFEGARLDWYNGQLDEVTSDILYQTYDPLLSDSGVSELRQEQVRLQKIVDSLGQPGGEDADTLDTVLGAIGQIGSMGITGAFGGAEMVATTVPLFMGMGFIAGSAATGPLAPLGGTAGALFAGGATVGPMFGAGFIRKMSRRSLGARYNQLINQEGWDESDAATAVNALTYSILATSIEYGLLSFQIKKLAAPAIALTSKQASKILGLEISNYFKNPTRAAMARNMLGRLAVVSAAEGFEEVTQGTFAEVLGNVVGSAVDEDRDLSVEDILDDFLTRLPSALEEGAIATSAVFLSGGMFAPFGAYRISQKVKSDQAEQDFFEAVGALKEDSSMLSTSDRLAGEFIGTLTDGTERNTIYIEPEALEEALAQEGITAEQAEAILPGIAERVQTARETVRRVAMPAREFASVVVNSNLMPHIRDHISSSQTGATNAQRKAAHTEAKKGAQFGEVVEEHSAYVALQSELDRSADKVAGGIVEQLVASGRRSLKVAKQDAQAVWMRVRALASQLSESAGKVITPEEAFALAPLTVLSKEQVEDLQAGQAISLTDEQVLDQFEVITEAINPETNERIEGGFRVGNGASVVNVQEAQILAELAGPVSFTHLTDTFVRAAALLAAGEVDAARAETESNILQFEEDTETRETLQLEDDSDFDSFAEDLRTAFETAVSLVVTDLGQVELAQDAAPLAPTVAEHEDSDWLKWRPTRTKDGKLKGVPEDIGTPAAWANRHRRVLKLAVEGAAGRFWYENSADAVLSAVNGNFVLAEKLIQLLAIYSAQASVPVNALLAVRAFTQWRLGFSPQEFSVSSLSKDSKAIDVLYNDKPFDGRKTNSFYLNLMHRIVDLAGDADLEAMNIDADLLSRLTRPVTSDVWVFRAYGYANTAASGDLGSGKYSTTENDLNRIAAELNNELEESEQAWLPHQAQAAMWTGIKARFELPRVKKLTNEQSLKAGHSFVNEKGNIERKNGADHTRAHVAIWSKNAFEATDEEAAEQVIRDAASFRDVLERMTFAITWEAIPSPSFGSPLLTASFGLQEEFQAAAARILIDEEGQDMAAGRAGSALFWSQEGAGGYDGGLAANFISRILPNKPSGEFSTTEANIYAAILQYIYKQNAVPWFRADSRISNENSYRVKNEKGKTIRRFSTQREAEAYAAEAKEGKTREVEGDPESRGIAFRFARAFDEVGLSSAFSALRAAFGPDVGFTRTAPNEMTVINFRGEGGLPFLMDDEAFVVAADKFEEQNVRSLQITEVVEFGVQSEYGYEHDWEADPEGAGVLTEERLAGRSDLHSWLAGRRKAFEQILGEYETRAAQEASLAETSEDPLFAQTEEDRRGFIQLEEERAIVALLAAADLSTFQHELGHWFLQQMIVIQRFGLASDRMNEDLRSIMVWLGVANVEDLTKPYADGRLSPFSTDENPLVDKPHEVFARGYEQWLLGGALPAPEFQSIFAKYRGWIIQTYGGVRAAASALGAPLPTDITSIYDRLFQVDAITDEVDGGFTEPLFPDAAAAGFVESDPAWKRYLKNWVAHKENAFRQVAAKYVMKVRAQREADRVTLVEKFRARAEEDVQQDPGWQAIRYLKRDVLPASGKKSKDNHIGLDRDAIRSVFWTEASGIIDALLARPDQGTGRNLVAGEGKVGIDPEWLAEMLGLSSARELVDSILQARTVGQLIQERVNREIEANDDFSEEAIQIEAEAAAVNDREALYLAELRQLRELASGEVLALARRDVADTGAPAAAEDQAALEDAQEVTGFLTGDESAQVLADAQAQEAAARAQAEAGTEGRRAQRAAARTISGIEERLRSGVLRVRARELISEVPAGNLRKERSGWQAQTVREGKRARRLLASRDYVGAAAAVERQLLAHHAMVEANKLIAEIDRGLKHVRKLGKKKALDRLRAPNFDGAAQIVKLYERYDFRAGQQRLDDPVEQEQAIESRKLQRVAASEALQQDFESLLTFQGKVEEEAHVLSIPEFVLTNNESDRRHWKELTTAELTAVFDLIRNIEVVSRQEVNDIRTGEAERLDDIGIRSGQRIRDANRLRKKNNITKPRRFSVQNMRALFRWGYSGAIPVKDLVDFLGGDDIDANIFRRYVFENLQDGRIAYTAQLPELQKAFSDAISKLDSKRMNSIQHVPELGGEVQRLRHYEIFMMFLHMGTESNLTRLYEGFANAEHRQWSQEGIDAAVRLLNDEEIAVAQDIWNAFEPLRVVNFDHHFKQTGIRPKLLERRTFIAHNGQIMQGGYMPAKYDGELSERARKLQEKADVQGQFGHSYSKAEISHGSTESRIEGYSAPLDLDPNVIANHIEEVVYDINLRKPVIDAWAVLHHPEVRSAIDDTMGIEVFQAIEHMINDVARRGRDTSNEGPIWKRAKRLNNSVRSGVVYAGLGYRMSTGLLQILGVLPVFGEIGTHWTLAGIGINMAHGVWPRVRANRELSSELKNRARTMDRDLNEYLGTLRGKSGTKARIDGNMAIFIVIGDAIVASIAWDAQRMKSMHEHGIATRAIREANRAIQRTQGSGSVESLSELMRAKGFAKWLTLFGSFFSNQAGLLARTFREGTGRQATKDVKGRAFRKARPLHATWLMASAFFIPAVLEAYFRGQGPDEGDDELWPVWAAKRTASFIVQPVPGLREFIDSVLFPEDRSFITRSNAARAYEIPANLLADMTRAFDEDEEFDLERLTLSAMRGLTIGRIAPLSQPDIWLDNFWDGFEGAEPRDFIWRKPFERR